MGKVRAGSQNARILHALRQGAWTSVAEIHRRAGTSRLNSRVSELRKHGWQIEHRVASGKSKATLAHQYRLTQPWPEKALPGFGPEPERHTLSRDDTPRDDAHRFRIYIVDQRNKQHLLATAGTEEQVGVEICRLGRAGEVKNACLGLLDTHGFDASLVKGTWLINPWDPRTS